MELKYIFAYADIKSVNEEDHSINFVPSTDMVDRQKEVVVPEALGDAITRPNEFSANPVALACHLHRLADGMPPVIGSWDIESVKVLAHRIEMRLRFAVDTRLGAEYWSLYRKGHMRAVSIGYNIVDGFEEMRSGTRVYIINKIELYEISCVAVGANPQALSKLKQYYTGDICETAKAAASNTGLDAVLKAVAEFKQQLDSFGIEIDELKSLIVDSDGFAEALLRGGKSEQPVPADDGIAAQYKRIQNILTKT